MNRAAMRRAVVRRIGRDDLDTEIDEKLDLCLSDELHQAHVFEDMLTVTDLSVTASDEYEALPAGAVGLHEARVIDSTSSYSLEIITRTDAKRDHPSPTDYPEANPEKCYIFDGNVYFIPVPDDDETVRVTTSSLPTMGKADASNPTVTVCDQALIAYATWQMFEQLEQFKSADRAERRYRQALLQAIRQDKGKHKVELRMQPCNLGREDLPAKGNWYQDPFIKVNP